MDVYFFNMTCFDFLIEEGFGYWREELVNKGIGDTFCKLVFPIGVTVVGVDYDLRRGKRC